jgi:hypothetical protein
MEASCRKKGPWPCAGANAAQAQNRLAKIVLAAMRFLLLLIDGSADMVGQSPHFAGNIFVAGEPQVNERCRARYCISVACGRHWLPVMSGGDSRRAIAAQSGFGPVPAAAPSH